ncbi:MAG: succinate dehydrogenase, cytochrome b556 subunit [Methylotenera sp.]|nr:succinate dehydrogenase, cytochrome b556 subunit [Methylotenera sp.]
MKNKQTKNRPKNLNLLTIRLPINAVVSILHRMSGVVLFLLIPPLLWSFQLSVTDVQSYDWLASLNQHVLVKLVLITCAWPFFHHFYAGIRHLAQDVHWMTSLQKAQLSSRLVLCLDTITVAIFAWQIW